MNKVTKEMGLQYEWFERARKIETIDELSAFAKELLVDTEHDYGTVCHAIAALSLAAAWLGAHIQDITGFQAGFVMWDFIKQWEFTNNKVGLRLVDYDKMLFPQYKDRFDKVISKETFERLQEEAKNNLESTDEAHPSVKKHWQEIVEGKVPFGYKVKEELD